MNKKVFLSLALAMVSMLGSAADSESRYRTYLDKLYIKYDELGNVSMTLSGTGTYIDIDQYLKSGKVTPAFDGLDEACGKACFDWYKEWKMKQTATGIRQTNQSATVLRTYYYNMEGKAVDRPQRGVYIVKEVLSDGKNRSRKVFYE